MGHTLCTIVLAAVLAKDGIPLPESLDRESLAECKAATVFVTHARASGSGFFVNSSGYLITNRHVVESAAGGEIKVVVRSGEEDQEDYTATVVALDDATDLALLRIDCEETTPLHLGDADELAEADSLWAFGYPLGDLFAQGKKGPGVSVNPGSVTALRKGQDGLLEAIQTDAQIDPGNSGGPLVSGDARVFGVIVARIRDTNLRFAIPSSTVRRFLGGRVTQLRLTPESLPEDGGQVTLEARVFSAMEACDRVRGRVEGPGVSEEIELKQDGDRWTGTWEVPARDPAERDSLVVKVRTRDGKETSGVLAIREVVVTHPFGKLTIPAEALVRVRYAAKEGRDVVETTQGVFEGKIEPRALGTDVAEDTLAEAWVARPEGRRFTISVRARIGGREVPGPSQTIQAGSTAAPVASAVPVAPSTGFTARLEGDMVEKKTPGRIYDAKLAAGGRMLAIHFKELKTIGIFDLEPLEFVKQIPLEDENALFAAGRSSLLIAYPTRSRLVRWNLSTLEKELTVETPVSGVVTNLEMGWNSEGPAILRWAKGKDALDFCQIGLLDVPRLRLLPQEDGGQLRRGSCYRDRLHMRVSADGRTIGGWDTSGSPSGLVVWRLGESSIEERYEHNSVGYVVPAEDGSCLFTQSSGIYAPDLKGGRENQAEALLPVPGGVYYLGMTGNKGLWEGGEFRGAIYIQSGRQKLLTLDHPLFSLTRGEMWTDNDFTLDKRIVALPEAKILVTIPETNDRIVIRRLDLDAALDASGIDYLYVSSTPTTVVAAGTAWEYAIRVRMTREGRPLTTDDVSDVLLTGVGGRPVYLKDVARVESGTGPTQIERRNRQRLINVTANVEPGYFAGNVNNAAVAAIRDIHPAGVSISAGGEAEFIAESGSAIGIALLLAIVLVYILLSALFESTFTPFAIMLALPMAWVGGILALLITGKALSLVSAIGFVLLTGLVMKNSILLVDYTNTLRARGRGRAEAIRIAGPTRLRPVLMTTLAVILGSLPTAIAFGEGSELRAPLAIVVIGGLIWSTLLTLLVIPVTYTILDDFRAWLGRLVSRRPARAPGAAEGAGR